MARGSISLRRSGAAISRQDVEEVVLSFGKYEGKAIKEVHDGYLRWMQATVESPWWKKLAVQVLEQRKQQQESGTKSRRKSLVDDLKRCRDIASVKQIHVEAIETGSVSCIYVATALVNMYAKCGSMVEARRVFDGIENPDVVSWTALILGYAENGEGSTALGLFARMRSQGCVPDSFTFVAALKACTSLALEQDGMRKGEGLEWGKRIHSEIGRHADIYVHNILIDLYAKCGNMVDAREVFDNMKQQDVVSWTSLILGYAANGKGVTALDMFARMRSRACPPNCITYVAALKACSSLGALESGVEIHAEIGLGTEVNSILLTSLVDFYAKCGSLAEARRVFDSHPRTRNLITWNALLAGYSRVGDDKAVFLLFKGMQDAGFRPNDITFLCILKCCSHVGLVEKASQFFEVMSASYGITPTVEHYTCMVDILGRSNKLEDAMTLLRSMPCDPNAVTWMTLLAACRKWKNADIGRLAFKGLVSLDDTNSAAYVLMGHIYGSRGMWEEQRMVSVMRKRFKAWKEPGQSCWTNGLGEVHSFLVGDNKHPQIEAIQEKLRSLFVMMREHGYVPDLLCINHKLTDNEKEEALCGHSERLALACALINTAPGKEIRIVKNLRVCDDCHVVTALVSKLEARTIICRDSNRFHVFKDGTCSCGDFW